VGSWGKQAQEFVAQLVEHHQQRTKGDPSEILLFLSMGGHAYPGVYIAQELSARLPGKPIFAIVNLPTDENQREAFLTLKARYEAAGVKSFLVGDQMEKKHVTQDSVIGDLFAGFSAASLFSDLSSSFNNVATGLGNTIQFSYIFSQVVARPVSVAKNTRPEYIAFREEVASEVRRLVALVETSQCAVSVRGVINPKRHQTYDLVLLALHPDDVRKIRDDVEGTREIEDEAHAKVERPHLHDKGNYKAVFAPWVQPVDPDHPRCQIAVIRLRSMRDEAGDLEELVKLPYKRAAAKRTVPATNGVVQSAVLDDF
jgi:hypothetical protein